MQSKDTQGVSCKVVVFDCQRINQIDFTAAKVGEISSSKMFLYLTFCISFFVAVFIGIYFRLQESRKRTSILSSQKICCQNYNKNSWRRCKNGRNRYRFKRDIERLVRMYRVKGVTSHIIPIFYLFHLSYLVIYFVSQFPFLSPANFNVRFYFIFTYSVRDNNYFRSGFVFVTVKTINCFWTIIITILSN